MVLYTTQTLTSAGSHMAADMTQQAILGMLGECEGAKGASFIMMSIANIDENANVLWHLVFGGSPLCSSTLMAMRDSTIEFEDSEEN